MVYLITYDLRKPGKNYQPLWDALHAIKAVAVLESVWMVRHTNSDPITLANYCLQQMDANDGIFVTEVSVNYAYRTLKAAPLAA